MSAVAFTVSRERMAQAVTRVSKVVQTRNTLPILEHLLLTAEGNTITVRGTDLDVDATVVVHGAEIATAGSITVPSSEFAQALNKWSNGDLRVESDGQRTTLKLNRSRATLQTLLTSDFPDIKAGIATSTFKLPGADLTAMAQRCGFAIAPAENRIYLTGMFLQPRGERLVAVATDGHRLSRFDVPLPEGAEDMPGVIIPGDTIKLWSHLLGKDESDDVTIEVSEDFIRFRSDLMVLHSKLVGAVFPDYERVVPRGNNQVVMVPLADLVGAVDRLRVFAGGKGDGIDVAFGNGAITMTAKSDTADAEEVVTADCDFELAIGFNGRYLREMLGSMAGPMVRIALSDPGSPALIGDEDTRREMVLMPMRVGR